MGIIRINSDPETIEPYRDVIRLLEKSRSPEKFGSDYSVTEIIDPPQKIQLSRRHPDELKVDKVVNALPAFIGNAVHDRFEGLLRRYSTLNGKYHVERRLYEYLLDRRIVGRIDALQSRKILWDIKVTSVWKLMLGDITDWETQLNFYAKMLRKDGHRVRSIRILAIFLDWKEMAALKNPKYPKSRITEYELDLWHPKVQDSYVKKRLQLHIDNEKLPDKILLPCTQKEMWEGLTEYAVYKDKKKLKRATRVFTDHIKAVSLLATYPNNGGMEVRPGVRKRCKNWCNAASICRQYGWYLKNVVFEMYKDGKNGKL